jgi:hypothetical protein
MAFGDWIRLAVVGGRSDDDRRWLLHMLVALVAKNRLKALAGGNG